MGCECKTVNFISEIAFVTEFMHLSNTLGKIAGMSRYGAVCFMPTLT